MSTQIATEPPELITDEGRQRWAAFAPLEERLADPQLADERGFDAATMLIVDALIAADGDALRAFAAALRRLQALWASNEQTSVSVGAGRLRQLLATAAAGLQRIPAPTVLAEVAPGTRAHDVLAAIGASGEVRNQELIDRLKVDPSEISRTGKRLVARGLVTRARAGKEVWWEVTDRGRAALERTEQRAITPPRPNRNSESAPELARLAEVRLEEVIGQLLARASRLNERSRLLTAELLLRQSDEMDKRLCMWQGVREFMDELPSYRVPPPRGSISERRAFLWDTLGEVASPDQLQTFSSEAWPVAPPLCDAYAVISGGDGRKGLVFIEARVSPQEFKQPVVQVRNQEKLRGLRRTVRQTRDYLGGSGNWWLYPDPALRLTFLHHLHEHLRLPLWLLNVYFVSAPEHSRLSGDAPRSEEEWDLHIAGVTRRLGLNDGHPLAPFLRHECLLEPVTLRDDSGAIFSEEDAQATVGR